MQKLLNKKIRGEIMSNAKKLMTVILAASMLAACGSKEEKKAEPVEQQEEVNIEVATEAEAFKAYIEQQMDDFVKDVELLLSLIHI